MVDNVYFCGRQRGKQHRPPKTLMFIWICVHWTDIYIYTCCVCHTVCGRTTADSTMLTRANPSNECFFSFVSCLIPRLVCLAACFCLFKCNISKNLNGLEAFILIYHFPLDGWMDGLDRLVAFFFLYPPR